jgi:DNA-binding protein HU-beta
MATKISKSTIVGKKSLGERITENLKRKRFNLTKIQVEAVISEFLEEIKKSLIKGEELRFPGYLSLKTTIQKPRVAMNLQTKKKMTIPAKRVPKVKFSEELKKGISKTKTNDNKTKTNNGNKSKREE